MTSLGYLEHRKTTPTTCWCLLCTNPVAPPHHLKAVGSGRDRTNPMMEHFTLAPDLCQMHHQEYHDIGERRFIEEHGNIWKFALLTLAEYLFKKEMDHEWEIGKKIAAHGKETIFFGKTDVDG